MRDKGEMIVKTVASMVGGTHTQGFSGVGGVDFIFCSDVGSEVFVFFVRVP